MLLLPIGFMNEFLYSTYVNAQMNKNPQQPLFSRYFTRILLISMIFIVYINVTKLQKPLVSYEQCPKINSTMLHFSKNRHPPYLTYIISSMPKRFNFTFNNLQTNVPNYFNLKHKQSVSLNDSRIFRNSDQSASSLLLTYIDLWRDFGARSEAEYSDIDWMFIFEDDVNVVSYDIIQKFYPNIYAKWNNTHPNTSITELIEQGLEMAKDDGILYLGTCGPAYLDNATTIRYSSDGLFEFRRGAYFCTHAVAYTKWRARRIWGDFAVYRFFHNEIGSDTIGRQWMILSKNFPLSAAANIHWPPGTGHYGFFYQDRGAIHSTRFR